MNSLLANQQPAAEAALHALELEAQRHHHVGVLGRRAELEHHLAHRRLRREGYVVRGGEEEDVILVILDQRADFRRFRRVDLIQNGVAFARR